MYEELYELSSGRRSFLDESSDDHVNPNKTRVFSLDYVLRDLEMGGDGLEAKDDVRSSELVVAMEKYLKFLDSVELVEIHQTSSLGSSFFL